MKKLDLKSKKNLLILVTLVLIILAIIILLFAKNPTNDQETTIPSKEEVSSTVGEISSENRYTLYNDLILVTVLQDPSIYYVEVNNEDGKTKFIKTSDQNYLYYKNDWYLNKSNYEVTLSHNYILDNIFSVINSGMGNRTYITCKDSQTDCIQISLPNSFTVKINPNSNKIEDLKYLGLEYSVKYDKIEDIEIPKDYSVLNTSTEAKGIYKDVCDELLKVNSYFICETLYFEIN